MAKEKIFLTGASSSLMQSLIYRIDRRRYDITGLTREAADKPGTIRWVEGDIRSVEDYSGELAGCYMVVHAAAVTHSRAEKEYFDTNVEGTQRLVDAARRRGVKRFVFISSRTAYDGLKSGAYAHSKLLGEEYVKEHIDGWVVLRIAELFGTGKGEGIERLIDDAFKKRIMACPVNLASRMYPLHVDDAAAIIHEAAFDFGLVSKTLTVNGREGFTCREIIRLVDGITGKRTLVVPVPRPVMYMIKRLVELLPIDAGIVPDQVPRLYGKKEHADPGRELLSLDKYLRVRLGAEGERVGRSS